MRLLQFSQVLYMIMVPVFTEFPQQYDLFPKKGCCSGTAPTTTRPSWHPRLWQKTLREATYQSIMRHTDFTGTLDDRLNRDHELWSKIKEALFKEEKSISDSGTDITTGVLVDRQRRNGLEFQQRDKSVYECPGEGCKSNKSLVALWRVRKTQDPNGLWIRVKLPMNEGTLIEDVYEYNVKYGLKHLLKNNEKLNISENKESVNDKIQDRVDIRFPEEDKGNMLMQNMNKQVVTKPHPAVIVETGRNFAQQPITNIGAIVATGPDGYRHVIHSLGQIPLHHQEFQQGIQYNGFLPSIGPIVQPPTVQKPIIVYDTPDQYNPSFINIYGQTLNNYYRTREQTTQKPVNFRPSKEFIQYSEVDPFFHQNNTLPMPEYKQSSFIINFPDSINAQLLPTMSTTELPHNTPDLKSKFQIIVGDYPTEIPKSTIPEENSISPTLNLVSYDQGNLAETESSLQQSTVKNEETTEQILVTDINKLLTTLDESILSNMIDINLNKIKNDTVDNSTEFVTNNIAETGTESIIDFFTNNFSENVLNSTLDIIRIMNETTTERMNTLAMDFSPTMLPEYNDIITTNNNIDETVTITSETTTYRIPSIFDDVMSTQLSNKSTKERDFDSIFSSLTNKLLPTKNEEDIHINKTISKPKEITTTDKEAQESLKEFRLLTYPGDPISIVEHRISTSVSYKTAKGETGAVSNKENDSTSKRLTQLIFKNNNALPGRRNSVVGRSELNTILSHLVKTAR